MARPITLCTGQWADLPLETLAPMAKSFGFDGLELACFGDHFEVDKALADPDYCGRQRTILEQNGLQLFSISNHLVGQAILDPVDDRHKAILPAYVWGDGDPAGVNARAAEAMKDAARAAQKLGVGIVNGFTGSSIWHLLYSFPPVPPAWIDEGFKLLAERFNPILDVFAECGVKFALEVHPDGNRVRPAHGPAGVGGAGLSPGVRLQFRSEPFDLAGSESGPIHPEVPRPYLSRPHEGCHRHAGRRQRDPGEPSELRRSAPRLGFSIPGTRRRQFRGDHPRPERHRLHRPLVGRMGRQRHGSRARREGGRRIRQATRFRPEPTRLRRRVRELR